MTVDRVAEAPPISLSDSLNLKEKSLSGMLSKLEHVLSPRLGACHIHLLLFKAQTKGLPLLVSNECDSEKVKVV